MSMEDWKIEKYWDDWFGLTHKVRPGYYGVTEGTRAKWAELLAAVRKGEDYYSKRLGFEDGAVLSPRNTDGCPDSLFEIGDPDAFADWVEREVER